jgi:serine/threonine protein kinase/class 3 adenylate cyclase
MTERTIGGKYRLEREIARGGMGAVWVAFDPQLKRRVAVKLMSPDQLASESLRGRFEREAVAIAQLQNPHVIQVYDYGIDGKTPYIVMELLEGEDLEARLRRQTRLPIATVCTLLTQAAKALGAAHAAGIVHRDLKPANMFLSRADSGEILKVLDFGVVAMVAGLAEDQHHVTRAGALIGTPSYMSPEQVRSAKGADHRSDLWSLGVVAYRALTGQLPFIGESLGDLIIRICTDAPAPPSSLVPGLSAEVDRFFEKALARDPAQRFSSAREMASAFAALVESEQPNKPTKILVIDDEPDVPLLVKQRFRQQIRKGLYEFVFATDGESALAELRRHGDIDVAMTDINMPGMDGLTFLKHVGEVNPILKVIMVSAYSDMTNIREAMNRGAFDFLVKPIDFKDLEITIDKTIKHVRDVRRTIRSTEENSILRMFVSNGIVERLLPMLRDTDVMPNEVVSATVAFIGVGRSPISSPGQISPDALVRRLNANFEVIVPEITSRKGVVDKFVGDAVMAVFRGKDHVERAIDACVTARSQLKLMAARAGESSPYAIGMAAGIDAGNVVSGSVGSKSLGRLDYTVLGNVVSAAAHLESIAEPDQIFISETAYAAAHEAFTCERVGLKEVPGVRELAAVYNVVERSSAGGASRSAETRAPEHSQERAIDPSQGTADQGALSTKP